MPRHSRDKHDRMASNVPGTREGGGQEHSPRHLMPAPGLPMAPDPEERRREWLHVLADGLPDLSLPQQLRLEQLALKYMELQEVRDAISRSWQPPVDAVDARFPTLIRAEHVDALDRAIAGLRGQGRPCFAAEAGQVADLLAGMMHEHRRDAGAAGDYGKVGRKDAAQILRLETWSAVDLGVLPQEASRQTDAELLEDWRKEMRQDEADPPGSMNLSEIVTSHAAAVRLSDRNYIEEVLTRRQKPKARDRDHLLELLPSMHEHYRRVLERAERASRRRRGGAAAEAPPRSEDPAYQRLRKRYDRLVDDIEKLHDKLPAPLAAARQEPIHLS